VIAFARHLASFYVLAGLFSDNHGPACLDSEAWNEVKPSVKDSAFLEEQADQLRSFSIYLLLIGLRDPLIAAREHLPVSSFLVFLLLRLSVM